MASALRHWSLKARISAAMAMLFVAAFVAAWFVQTRYLRVAYASVASAQVESDAARMAAEIDAKFATSRRVLEQSAEVIARERPTDPAAFAQHIRSRPALFTLFDDFLLLDLSGGIVADYPVVPGRRGVDLSDRAFFREALARSRTVVSDPLLGKTRREPIVQIGTPVIGAGGRPEWILTGVLRLQQPNLLGNLVDAKIGRTGYYVVLTRTRPAVYVSHPDRTRILQPRPAAGARAVTEALDGFEGAREDRSSLGVQTLYVSKLLKSVPWVLVAAAPTADVFAPLAAAERNLLAVAVVAALLTALVAWTIVSWVMRPLQRLEDAMARVGRGEALSTLPVTRGDEVGDLTIAFNDLVRGRIAAETALKDLALRDALTGLPNRRALDEALASAIARNERSGKTLALLFLDLDGFKAVNDTLGHDAGDAVLQAVATRLESAVRRSDIVARFGGDEFAVVLEGLSGQEEAQSVASKLIDTLREPFETGKGECRIGASVGIATCGPESCGPQALAPAELLRRADAAAYRAKGAGRGTWQVAPATVA